MNNLKINCDGTIMLKDEIIESSTQNIEDRVSNIIDFESGNLFEKKLSLQTQNFIVTGRDTVMQRMKTYGLSPYISHSTIWGPNSNVIDLKEYIDSSKTNLKFKLKIYYKFKIMEAPLAAKDENIDLGFGLYVQTDGALTNASTDYNWIRATVIGRFFNKVPDRPSCPILEPGKEYEGYCETIIDSVTTRQCQWQPWIQLAGWDNVNAIKIKMYDYSMEIEPISGFINNKLLYPMKSLKLRCFPDSGKNYQLKYIKILDENGNALGADRIDSITPETNTSDNLIRLVDPNNGNLLVRTAEDCIDVVFKNNENISNIILYHDSLEPYRETIIAKSPSNKEFLVFRSNNFTPHVDTSKFYNYNSGGIIDTMMSHNFINHGLKLTDYCDLDSRPIRLFPDNIIQSGNLETDYGVEVVPDLLDLRNDFNLKINNSDKFISKMAMSVLRPYGGFNVIFNVYIKVSLGYYSNIGPYISYNSKDTNSTNTGYNVEESTSYYDMSKKGEWQLLTLSTNEYELNKLIEPTINVAKDFFNNGYVEISKPQVIYAASDRNNSNLLKYPTNAIVKFTPNITNNKSIYLEIDLPNVIKNEQTILRTSGNNNMRIYVNSSKTLTIKTDTSNNVVPNVSGKVKICINRNGSLFVNGSKINSEVKDWTDNDTTILGDVDKQFLGTYHRLEVFYNDVSDDNAINITTSNKPRIPINSENFIEKNKDLYIGSSYKCNMITFPLENDFYDTTKSFTLPSSNDPKYIMQGVGYCMANSTGDNLLKDHLDMHNAIFHQGNLSNITEIELDNVGKYTSLFGILDFLSPSDLQTTDKIEMLSKDNNGNTSVISTFYLANKKIFTLLGECTTGKIVIRITSNSDISIKHAIAKSDGGCLFDKEVTDNKVLAVNLNNLINTSSSYTVFFDAMVVMTEEATNPGLSAICSCLGTIHSRNYFCVGKFSTGSPDSSAINASKIYSTPSSEINSLGDWINGERMRTVFINDSDAKTMRMMVVRLRDRMVMIDSKYSYSTLDLGSGDSLFIMGDSWFDKIPFAPSIISNLNFTSSALSDDNLDVLFTPMSIGKDYVRAGFEFSESNII